MTDVCFCLRPLSLGTAAGMTTESSHLLTTPSRGTGGRGERQEVSLPGPGEGRAGAGARRRRSGGPCSVLQRKRPQIAPHRRLRAPRPPALRLALTPSASQPVRKRERLPLALVCVTPEPVGTSSRASRRLAMPSRDSGSSPTPQSPTQDVNPSRPLPGPLLPRDFPRASVSWAYTVLCHRPEGMPRNASAGLFQGGRGLRAAV